jgi:hypothetical protein
MSLSKSRCWYSNNRLYFLKCAFPLPVNGESLEELRALSDGLWMLNNDPNRSGAGPVGDLDPVAADASKFKKMLQLLSTKETVYILNA